ncbi:MAG: hypothetical protein MPJ50_18110 [Pirellulales bacterium]|nr:hypothetical protein [Pirellulales bacterium]
MSSYWQQISDEWRAAAKQLAAWTMKFMVNRTDVWGRYLPKKYRKKIGPSGDMNNAVTAPFRDERGKVLLQVSSLEKHYKTNSFGGVLGLHSISSDHSSRWLGIDVDLHDEDNLSVTPEGNFVAAHGWWQELVKQGLDPLLLDSNGAGGFHLLVVFAEAMDTRSVHQFGHQLVSDYSLRGLDVAPEIFPGAIRAKHYGNWLRLPGRHHSRQHYTRVWNDEPLGEDKWLEGYHAIERILRMRPAPAEALEPLGIIRRRPTVCVDFDGVIHSYRSGWQGETVIADPPIHRCDDAIARLRKGHRVVIHSARCATQAGRDAIWEWLAKHGIEVDDVCEHKPPAKIYLDDRGIQFSGDWDQAIADIYAFRR